MWALWREHNQRVWSNESTTARRVVEGGAEAILEWRAVRERTGGTVVQRNQARTRCGKWHVPPDEWVKCNVDSSFRLSERKWGSDMILRSSEGAVVSCRSSWKRGRPAVRDGEALALLEALLWVEHSVYTNVVFEVDSTEVEQAIKHGGRDVSEFGLIISECRHIVSSRQDFSVVVVRRDRNKAAHELAQQSYTFASPSVWHATPFWLGHALSDVCMDLNH
ncbi:hypothetical protein LINPERHAP1_LOCUS10452 [Linum perenne]